MSARHLTTERDPIYVVVVAALRLVLLFALLAPASAAAQGRPITKDGLFEAVKIGGLSTDEMSDLIKVFGVDFKLTREERQQLAAAGVAEKVLKAIDSNYKGPKHTKGTDAHPAVEAVGPKNVPAPVPDPTRERSRIVAMDAKGEAPVSVAPRVQAARLVYQPKLSYPYGVRLAQARMEKLGGPVKFRALIGKDGTVEYLERVTGHPMLASVAEEAVMQWRYAPLEIDGKAVSVATDIEITFALTK